MLQVVKTQEQRVGVRTVERARAACGKNYSLEYGSLSSFLPQQFKSHLSKRPIENISAIIHAEREARPALALCERLNPLSLGPLSPLCKAHIPHPHLSQR